MTRDRPVSLPGFPCLLRLSCRLTRDGSPVAPSRRSNLSVRTQRVCPATSSSGPTDTPRRVVRVDLRFQPSESAHKHLSTSGDAGTSLRE